MGDELEITYEYYEARLSRQMGQLERLIYKREHGLELDAGGKSHGAPPKVVFPGARLQSSGSERTAVRTA